MSGSGVAKRRAPALPFSVQGGGCAGGGGGPDGPAAHAGPAATVPVNPKKRKRVLSRGGGARGGRHVADSTAPRPSSARAAKRGADPTGSATAARRVHDRALVDAGVSGALVVRDTDLRRALAVPTPPIVAGEAHVVDPAVQVPRALRAHLDRAPLADARGVGTGVAVAEAVPRLVLVNAGDHHLHGVSFGIG